MPPRPTFARGLAWQRGLNLCERVASLRATPAGPWQRPSDATGAKQRLDKWRSQYPFSSGAFFEQRVAQSGLTADALLDLLGEPSNSQLPVASVRPFGAKASDQIMCW